MRGTLVQQVGEVHIRQARLTLRNGTETSLRDVTVRSDSVIGLADDGRVRRAVPFANVASIEKRQVSILRTGAVMAGTAALTYVALVVIAFSQLPPNWSAVPSPAPSVR